MDFTAVLSSKSRMKVRRNWIHYTIVFHKNKLPESLSFPEFCPVVFFPVFCYHRMCGQGVRSIFPAVSFSIPCGLEDHVLLRKYRKVGKIRLSPAWTKQEFPYSRIPPPANSPSAGTVFQNLRQRKYIANRGYLFWLFHDPAERIPHLSSIQLSDELFP